MAKSGAGDNNQESLNKDVPTSAEIEAASKALEIEISQFKYAAAQYEAKKTMLLNKNESFEARKKAHFIRDINAERAQLNENLKSQMKTKFEEQEARAQSAQAEIERLQFKAREKLKNPPRTQYEVRKFKEEQEQLDSKLLALINSISTDAQQLDEEIKAFPQKISTAIDNLTALYLAERESLKAERAQLEAIKEQLKVEKEQLVNRHKILKEKIAQHKTEVKEASLRQNSQIEREGTSNTTLTFAHQTPSSQQSAVISHSGIAIQDLTDFLRKNENLAKLNHDSKRTFVQVERSLQSARNNEVKFELIGQNGEKAMVYAKGGKTLSGIDKIDFFVNKEANNDVETLRSVCRLAALSASEKNIPAEFKINQKHPLASEIKAYLTEAILEIAKDKPELACQFKIDNNFPYYKQEGSSHLKASK